MARECANCGNLLSSSATSCKQCGSAAEAAAAPAMTTSKTDDTMKYVTIIGGLLAACVVLFILASGMGMTDTCEGCKGRGYTLCRNCKDGRPKCLTCKGSGRDPQNFSTCTVCAGKGDVSPCPACKDHPKKQCATCQGSGRMKS